MAMTPEQQKQFDAIARRIEKYARRQPAYYRLRVGLLAALGYAYILFIFLLLCGFIWALRQAVLSTQAQHLTEKINFITFLLGLGIVRLFWVNFPAPKGVELSRQQVPQLFALIDELTAALQAPKFHHILLTDDLNAGVLQRPRLCFLGWHKNYLLLGLPLLQALSPLQFRAVVAHELGHLSGNHSRFAGWIYRVRKIWFDLAERFQNSEERGFFLFQRFFNWYGPFFNAYSFVLARADEYEADRCAAELAGGQNAAEGLISLEINSSFLHNLFWIKVYKQALHLPEPPDDIITRMLHELKTGAAPADAAKWLDRALAEKTDNDDTHPCLSERLSALGYQAIAQPAPVQETAAERFLGKAIAGECAARLDANWKTEIQKTWIKLHARAQQQIRHLTALEGKAETRPLTVEETWKRAYLTWYLQGNKAAVPLFREVLARSPEHPLANYQLGQILLENNDASAIAHLETAIEGDPALVTPGCELLYGFYRQQGKSEEAAAYLLRGQQHGEAWKQAQQERYIFIEKDRFAPHNLPEEEVKQLAEQLSDFLEVREAYLARKEVTLFPEKPFYILGISRRFVKGSGVHYQSDWELSDRLQAELNFSGNIQVLIFNQGSANLIHALRLVPGGCIYRS